MPSKLADRPKEARLTVDEAVRQIRSDCNEIKLRISDRGPLLSEDKMLRIREQAGLVMRLNGRRYSYYEIGHRFIVDHMIASVNKKVQLSSQEEQLLTAVMGRVHDQPPPSEYRSSADAADALQKEGHRADQILAACKESYRELRGELLKGPLPGLHHEGERLDMFTNPFAPLYVFDIAKSFGQVAARKRGSAESIEEFQRSAYF